MGSPYLSFWFTVLLASQDGAISICIEYMDAGSLLDVLTVGGPFSEDMIAWIAWQVCWVVQWLQLLVVRLFSVADPSTCVCTDFEWVRLPPGPPPDPPRSEASQHLFKHERRGKVDRFRDCVPGELWVRERISVCFFFIFFGCGVEFSERC